MAFAIGPALGFMTSSFTTKLYVDFDRVSAEEIPDIDQYDPRWVGAWWLGFLVVGILMLLLGKIWRYRQGGSRGRGIGHWTEHRKDPVKTDMVVN